MMAAALAALSGARAAPVAGPATWGESLQAEFQRLRTDVVTRDYKSSDALLKEVTARLGPPPASHRYPQSKIEHMVVLFLENRAADHIFGCFGLPGFDGIPPEGRVLWADPANHSAGSVTVSCGGAPYGE